MAQHLKAAEPEGPNVIVGYSAGIFAAIELAIRLEGMGEVGSHMFMLPGS